MKYVCLILILVYGCNPQNTSESIDQFDNGSKSQSELTVGDLELVDLNGVKVQKAIFEDKPVFVNLWATWCGPCIKEMPAIKRMMEKVGIDKMHFIFPSDESLKKIQRFENRYKHQFQYYQLKTGFEKLGIYSLPTTLLFDKDGKHIKTIVGAKEWDSEENVGYLKELVH